MFEQADSSTSDRTGVKNQRAIKTLSNKEHGVEFSSFGELSGLVHMDTVFFGLSSTRKRRFRSLKTERNSFQDFQKLSLCVDG